MVSQFVQGSVLYDPARRQVAFASGPSLERAGISGRVFLDGNGDGRWQPGEQPVSGVRVRAGFVTTLSDSSGRYRIWDLPAFEPVLVAVDTATLDSPLWIPAYGSMSVETGPNRFRSVDIPIVPGGVIEGRVVRQTLDSTVAIPGARLLLRRHGSSQTARLVTFSDGGFYLIGVKPGEYELSVEPAVLSGWGSRRGRSRSPCRRPRMGRLWTGWSCGWSSCSPWVSVALVSGARHGLVPRGGILSGLTGAWLLCVLIGALR